MRIELVAMGFMLLLTLLLLSGGRSPACTPTVVVSAPSAGNQAGVSRLNGMLFLALIMVALMLISIG
jgi:hypothetical protein